jgi:hypothetical protein
MTRWAGPWWNSTLAGVTFEVCVMSGLPRAALALAAAILVALAGLAAPGPVLAKTPAAPAAKVRNIDARPWPREYSVGGVEFSIYRPQIDSWTGDRLKARAVMAVRTGEATDSVGGQATPQDFGVIWLSARTETDKEAREVTLGDVTIERANFPNAKAKEARYLALARKVAPTTELVASLDAIEASMAITRAAGANTASQPVDNTPPEILFATQPAVLVLIDGQPVLKPAGVAGVQRVINTRAVLLKYQGAWFLGHAGVWLQAPALDGGWSVIGTPPAALTQVADKLAAAHPDGQPAQAGQGPAAPPPSQVFVRTHPAELIDFDGEPQFDGVAGTSLKYAVNTPSDVLTDATGAWYVLLAGRWFTAASTKGPWRYVDPRTLPADFARIPSDGPKGAVLASIPGTPEAQESLVANAIPQTASVDRRQAHFEARYDGAPEFRPIAGTSLTYAVNSGTPVIHAAGAFYALDNGVWFKAAAPAGPWAVATSVPPAIYAIPSASPLHYVTYAYVYGSSGDQIYVGYTPGYYGTVVTGDVVVYGSGYPCDPWIGAAWYGCPSPYGYGAVFGYGAAVGWALAFGWGWYDPWYAPWWGPWGYWPGYYYGGAIAGNVYGRWGNSVVAGTAAAWANPWTGNYGRAGQGGYYNQATGGRGYGYAGRNTNIYTGRGAAAAGGARYNPQTGRAVGGHGGSVYNIYTGEGAAGGQRTVVNTDTGRVTQQAGVAGRGAEGAGAAGGFKTTGQNGQAAGAGYVHYDRDTGDLSKGGVVDVNGQIYAGKDGNVYKHTDGGWEQAGPKGDFSRADHPDPSLDAERLGRDRGFERETAAGGGFERQGASRPTFDRGAMGGGFQGHMGGFRGGGGFRRR